MTKLVLTVGIPGAGKDFYAKELIARDPTFKRVNRDIIRELLDFSVWSEYNERIVRKAELALANIVVDAGYNLIVTDTNLSKSAMAMWTSFGKNKKLEVEVV